MAWFSVRNIFLHVPKSYEERIVLIESQSMDGAIERGREEGLAYAEDVGKCRLLGLTQAFEIVGPNIEDGSEVFSLIRQSELLPNEYVARFFDTGHERQT